MQLLTVLLALLSVSSAVQITCGWDPQMSKNDCLLLLSALKQSNSPAVGATDYRNCHVIFSQSKVLVSKDTFMGVLRDCLAQCGKFDHIYCRYSSVTNIGNQRVDMIVGTHL